MEGELKQPYIVPKKYFFYVIKEDKTFFITSLLKTLGHTDAGSEEKTNLTTLLGKLYNQFSTNFQALLKEDRKALGKKNNIETKVLFVKEKVLHNQLVIKLKELKKNNQKPIHFICLDKSFISDERIKSMVEMHSLDFSRVYDFNNKKIGYYYNDEELPEKIKEGESVYIFEDDIFSGGTMETFIKVLKQKHPKIKIEEIITCFNHKNKINIHNISTHTLYDLSKNIEKDKIEEDNFDIIDIRDFLFPYFFEDGGLRISDVSLEKLKNQKSVKIQEINREQIICDINNKRSANISRIAYMPPMVAIDKRASIKQWISFCLKVLELNKKLLKELQNKLGEKYEIKNNIKILDIFKNKLIEYEQQANLLNKNKSQLVISEIDKDTPILNLYNLLIEIQKTLIEKEKRQTYLTPQRPPEPSDTKFSTPQRNSLSKKSTQSTTKPLKQILPLEPNLKIKIRGLTVGKIL